MRVNVAAGEVHVKYDDARMPVTGIVDRLTAAGYPPHPPREGGE